MEILKQIFNSSETDREKETKELTAQVDKQKQRLQKLQDMVIDNKISIDDYNKMKSRFESIKEQSLLKLRELKSVKSNFEKHLQTGINVLANLEKFYHKADIEVKQQIIRSIFPEKLVFDSKKVRTARINEVMRLILMSDKGNRRMKKGQLTKNLWLSTAVEHIGIEPMTS